MMNQKQQSDPSAMLPKLYGFFRSGTSHRVRIALNLKGLQYEQIAIDLRLEKHQERS
jgi:glutathione S-transferase